MNNVNNKNFQHFRSGGDYKRRLDTEMAKLDLGDQPETIDPDYARFKKIFFKDSKFIEISDFSICMFHNWFDNMQTKRKSLSIEYEGSRFRHRIRFERRTETGRELVSIIGIGRDKKSQLYNIISQLNGVVVFQMDQESNDVQVASNTEVIGTETESVSGKQEVGPMLQNLCSHENDYSLDLMTNRYELFSRGVIKRDVDMKKTFLLPKELINDTNNSSANLSLFKNFVYSKLEIEIRIIVNAPKFAQGQIVLSWFPDPHENVYEEYTDAQSLIQRPHVIIDLSRNNQATILIPQQIRRGLVRNIAHESTNQGTIYGEMCAFQIATLSKYMSEASQPGEIPYQLFYRFVDAKFYGMSYAVNLQGGDLMSLAAEIYPPIGVAERLLKRAGFIGNQDKPYFDKKELIVPTARRDFCSGNGLSDSIPLAFDGKSTITNLSDYINSEDPKNMIEIAKVKGLLGRFNWTTADESGKAIWEWVVYPTSRGRWDEGNSGHVDPRRPTPIDFVSSQYAFWRGSIKLKFVFVCTSFHTGTIQFEISYNRIPANITQAASTYTKTFDLVEESEFEFEIPYIYDTVWRRTSQNVQWGYSISSNINLSGLANYDSRDQITFAQPYPLSTQFISNTRVTARVINPLTPISSVLPQMEVLVFIGAGDDFELQGVVPNFYCLPDCMLRKDSSWTSGYVNNIKQFPIFDTTPFDSDVVPDQDRVLRVRGHLPSSIGQKTEMKAEYDSYFRSLREAKDGLRETYYERVGSQSVKREKIHKATENKIVYQAPNMRHFHSTDPQIDFKLLMRRNYLLCTINVDPRDSGEKILRKLPNGDSLITMVYRTVSNFYLPTYLPSQLIAANQIKDCWGTSVSTIPTLFRHWRGSLRYTIISAKGAINCPVYVAYLPNMGTTYFGNKVRGTRLVKVLGNPNGDLNLNYNVSLNDKLGASGLAVEVMLPRVNDSISISVPFDVMHNRCVNASRIEGGDESSFGKITAREESTFHSGHLLIECDQRVDLDIFISAGDDMEVMDFVGTVNYVGSVNVTIPDTYVRTTQRKSNLTGDFRGEYARVKRSNHIQYQMFSGFNTMIDSSHKLMAEVNKSLKKFDKNSSKVVDFVSNSEEKLQTITNDIDKVASNFVKNSDIVTGEVRDMKEISKNVSFSLDMHLKKISDNVERCGSQFDKVGDNINMVLDLLRPGIEKTRDFFGEGSLASKAFDLSRDFLFDLVLLLRNFDYVNFGIMFMKYIAKVLNVGIEKLISYGEELGQMMKRLCGFEATEQFSAEKSTHGSLFGFFVSLLGVVLKYKCSSEKKFYDHGSKLKDFIFDGKNVNYVNSLISLVERVFKTFSDSITFWNNNKDTEKTVREVLAEQRDDIARFCIEVEEITDPSNQRIAQRSDIKAKTWKNYIYAKFLLRKLAECTGNAASAVIMKYVNKIMMYCEKNWNKLACCPVRYEPRVYCFAGESNCGKSFVSTELIMECLRGIGYRREGGQPIFTRAPGRKHWDGFGLDQQVVVFDDWMNISNPEQIVEQVSDLYELKSTCDFLPPMAAVEEKGIRCNPRMVVLLTNSPFPHSSLVTVCKTPEAVYRRRDKLIWVKRKPGFEKKDLRLDLTDEESLSYSHLLFAYGNPRPNQDGVAQTIDDPSLKWIEYNQLKHTMVEDFVIYNEIELKHVKRRLDMMCADLPEEIRELSDPMEIYNLRQYETLITEHSFDELLPSKFLERHINECLRQLGTLRSGGGSGVQEQAPNAGDFIKRLAGNGSVIDGRDFDLPSNHPFLEVVYSGVNLHRGVEFAGERIYTVYEIRKFMETSHSDLVNESCFVKKQAIIFNSDKSIKCAVCRFRNRKVSLEPPVEVMKRGSGMVGTEMISKRFLVSEDLEALPAWVDCMEHKHILCFIDLEWEDYLYGKDVDLAKYIRNTLQDNCNYAVVDINESPRVIQQKLEYYKYKEKTLLFFYKNRTKVTFKTHAQLREWYAKCQLDPDFTIVKNIVVQLDHGLIWDQYNTTKYFLSDLEFILCENSALSDSIGLTIELFEVTGYLDYRISDPRYNIHEWINDHSRNIKIFGRDVRSGVPVDFGESNDEQFPAWELSGYNQINAPYPLFVRDYENWMNHNQNWLFDWVKDRNTCPISERDRSRYPNFEEILGVWSGYPNMSFDDDQATWADIVIQLPNGEKKYVMGELKDPLSSISCVSAFKCDHCGGKSLFHIGTKQHHTCVSCYRNKSVCNYCVQKDCGREIQIYWTPIFWWLFDANSLSSGWLNRLIQVVVKIGIGYISMKIIKGILGMFGLLGKGIHLAFGFLDDIIFGSSFSFQSDSESVFDSDTFWKAINDIRVYEDVETCLHDDLLDKTKYSLDGLMYLNERWVLDNGEEMSWSIYPCKCNCSLMSRQNLRRYEALCRRFCELNSRLIRIRMDNHFNQEPHVQIPFFCYSTIEVERLEGYRLGAMRNRTLKEKITQFFSTNMRRLGMNPTMDWCSILLSCSAAILSLVGLVKGIFGLVGWLRGTKEQGTYSGADATRHFSKKKTKPNVSTKPNWKESTRQSQNSYYQSLVKYITRNQIGFVFYKKDGTRLNDSCLMGVGIRNRVVILPKHFVRELERVVDNIDDVELRLWQPAFPNIVTRTYVYDASDFLISENSDIAVFYAPKQVSEFVNITNYFQSSSDCDHALPSHGLLLRCPSLQNSQIREIETRIYGYEARVDVNGSEPSYGVIAHGHSEPGACGSLLLKQNSTRPIIGMHFAGTTPYSFKKRGFCIALSSDTFADIDFKTAGVVGHDEPCVTYPVEDSKIHLSEDMVEVQLLFAHEKEVHLPEKTKIRPSLLNNYDGPPVTRPAFLSSRETDYPHDISPLVAGIAKHGILTKNFKSSDVWEVRDILWERKYMSLRPMMAKPKKLTVGESIRGFNIPGYEPMKLNTSMGYPFIFDVKKKKKDYVEVTDEIDIEDRTVRVSKPVLDHLNTISELRSMGVVPFLPYVDELKDERRKIEKAMKIGGTRVFCMSAFATTVAARQNFLHFAAAYKNGRYDLQHAVGVARDGPEWGIIANKLLTNSDKIVTLDYSNFGPGYNVMVNSAGHDIITRWTKQNVSGVTDLEMEILGEEHYNSVHIAGDLVYQQLSGGPSGDALTVIKNGLVNELYILLAWKYLFEQNVGIDESGMYTKYFDNVVLFTYGDDAIISITDEVIDWFNGDTISSFFSEYGIVATDAEKSGNIQEFKSISEATFLKSHFVPHPKHPGEWLAPIDMVSITECPRWVYSSDNLELSTLENCDQAIRLCYGHGPSVFDSFKKKINEALVEKELTPIILLWRELDKNFFPQYYV